MLLLDACVLLRFGPLVTHARILCLIRRITALVELDVVAVFRCLIRLGEIVYGSALVRRLAYIIVVLMHEN
jgi:hypothetical protein